MRLLEYILHEEGENGATSRRPWVLLGAVLAGCALLALLWASPPFQAWLAPSRLLDWADPVKESPLAPLIVIGAYMVGALIVFPLLLLIVYTAMLFGPMSGGVYALVGCLAGAIAMYGVGRGLGRHTVRKLTGRRLNRLTRRLAGSGTLAVAAVRLVPVAPASIVSLICGAVGIRFPHFTLGTLIGVTPGVLALTVFGDQLGRTLRSPTPVEIAVACTIALVVVGMVLWIRRGFQGGRPAASSEEEWRPNPSLSHVPRGRGRERGPMRRLELASYNIHRCIGVDRRKDPGRIVAVIGEMAPDIVALQEVESARAAHQPEFLSSATGYEVLLGTAMERHDGQYGNALLIRSRILGVRRIDLSLPRREPRCALDGIWARPTAALHGLQVHRSPLARVASDHLPVRATIVLEDRGRAAGSEGTGG